MRKSSFARPDYVWLVGNTLYARYLKGASVIKMEATKKSKQTNVFQQYKIFYFLLTAVPIMISQKNYQIIQIKILRYGRYKYARYKSITRGITGDQSCEYQEFFFIWQLPVMTRMLKLIGMSIDRWLFLIQPILNPVRWQSRKDILLRGIYLHRH